MKKTMKSLIAAALAVCCITPLAACGNGAMLTDTPNAGISAGVADSILGYSALAYYELENPSNVEISFKTKEIQKVSFKYRVLENNEYTFSNNTLTVNKSVFKDETAGDKRLRVFVDNKYVEITIRVVSKVIYTVEDFNSIRNNLNGVYVLGADIDFGGKQFYPIGKPLSESESTGIFEGVFDGMGHSVQNVVINAYDYGEGEDGIGQGPSLGHPYYNGLNSGNGIFMSTGGSAQIINTDFSNITVSCYALSGAVVGSNGGLIKNCTVTCTMNTAPWDSVDPDRVYSERAGAIVGINGSGDAAGRIENCIAIYSWSGKLPTRGIADWNNGIIKNCYAALKDDYVFHVAYDNETKSVPEDFDYDDFFTQDNYGLLWGNYTVPAFPGSHGWVNGESVYYKGGDIINSDVVRKEFLLDSANFSEDDGWDRNVWSIVNGGFPTLKIQDR